MSAECVTDAMAKAARLRFEADEADDVVDWYAVVGAALSAADAVRGRSASGAVDHLKFIRKRISEINIATHDCRSEALVEVRELLAWGHQIDTAIAALRQQGDGA